MSRSGGREEHLRGVPAEDAGAGEGGGLGEHQGAGGADRAQRLGRPALQEAPDGQPGGEHQRRHHDEQDRGDPGGRRQQPTGAEVDRPAHPRQRAHDEGHADQVRQAQPASLVHHASSSRSPSGPGRTPEVSIPSTRSATRRTSPPTRSVASGSASSHGTRTKARSWARGWGRVERGVVRSARRCRTPGRRTGRGRGRACAHPTAPRACGRGRARCRAGSAAATRGASRGRAHHHRVEVCRLVRSADRVGLVRPGRPRRCRRAPRSATTAWCSGLERLAEVGAEGDDDGASRARARTRTCTSVKGWPTGAWGLCTMTSTASTRGRVEHGRGDPLRQRAR